MDAAAKKRAFQWLAEARGGGIGRFWILSHFQVGITAEQMKTANILHVLLGSASRVAAMGDTD
jgi:hypothetical protein